jgi:hypothetical protein
VGGLRNWIDPLAPHRKDVTLVKISRRRLAVRSALALVLAAAAAVPLLGDLGLTGRPQEAAAAHIADRSRLITAVSRATNHVDAFWVDPDRRIMTAGYVPGQGWSAPARIANGTAGGGTSVFGVARAADRMDIFSITPNRRVQTAFWTGSSWNGWHQLGSLVVKAGTNVHAIANANRMDIVAVGEDRVFYINTWRAETEWSGWTALSGIEAADNTSAYAVYPHGSGDIVHVFGIMTVRTGGLVLLPPDGPGLEPDYWYTASNQNVVFRKIYKPDTGWGDWTYAFMVTKPETSVFPISTRNGTVVIFGTDESGTIVKADWSTRAGWGGWAESYEGRSLDRATVFASVRKRHATAAEYAVAVPGTDADIWTRHGGASPTGWQEVPGTPKTGEAFIMSAGEDRYNVFAWRTPNGSTGEVVNAGWTPSGGWTGWTRIDD